MIILVLYSLFFTEGPVKRIACDERLTIEHILLTCSGFVKIRESHFTAQSLHVLFREILLEKIFRFLKKINIFDRIQNFQIILGSVRVLTTF